LFVGFCSCASGATDGGARRMALTPQKVESYQAVVQE
jgi:hypothetical protein